MANPFPRNGLTKQQVSLKLTGGIDRKTDPKQLQNGQMYTADNVQYTTEGQLRKRFGYTTLNPPGGLQGAPFAAVGVRDNVEPIVLGTGALNRFNPTTGLSTAIPANTQGRLAASNVAASSAIGGIASPPVNASCATDGQKYAFVVWEEIDTSTHYVFYGVQDIQNGSWIISPTQIPLNFNTGFSDYLSTSYTLTGQGRPRAFYNNGYFYIAIHVYGSGTYNNTTVYGGAVKFAAMNLLNLSAGFVPVSNSTMVVASQLANTQSSNYGAAWDAVIANNVLYFCWIPSGGTSSGSSGTGSVTALTINGTSLSGISSGNFTYKASQSPLVDRVSIAIGQTAVPIAITTQTSLVTMTSPVSQFSQTNFAVPITDASQCFPTATIWMGNVAYGFAIGYSPSASVNFVCALGYDVVAKANSLVAYIPAPSTSLATGIVSRPWVYNNRIYLWIFSSGFAGWGVYRDQVLLEVTTNPLTYNFVARTAYQTAGLVNQQYSIVPNDVINIPNTSKYVAYLTQTTDVVGGTAPKAAIPANSTTGTAAVNAVPAKVSNTFYGVLTRTQFDFRPPTPSMFYNIPTGGVFLTGAFPQQYDGQFLTEAGFSVAPELMTAPGLVSSSPTVFTASGSGLAAGSYTYYLVFCRRDAYGNVIRSSPSSPIVVTTTATYSSVIIPAITYFKVPNVYIEVYRTTIAIPSQPQFVAKVSPGVPYTDNNADSVIASNPTLYTYSGEYPNDPPPAVHSMAVGETRAYIIPSDSRNTIWCSKKFSPGRSVEWTSNLILTEGGTHSGSFTAIAVLDTNVIVFKQDQILYFYGDGPDNAGATGSFSAFQRLSSDVGCIDPGSLAIIPAGLLFRSQRGIELLSRGLQVSYVGFPIEPLVQAITTIGSATVMPQYQQVRFVPSVVGQPVLVYDYLANRWSTYSSMAALSTANVNGNYWWISADGSTCNVETPGAFLDAGTNFIQMTIETPEIPTTSIQGWGRVYRLAVLGEMKTSHALVVSFAYDHQETYTDNVTYNAASSEDNGGVTYWYDNQGQYPVAYVIVPGPEQFRFSRVPRQVMQTLKLKLQDNPLTVYYNNDAYMPLQLPFGESCAISNITLEIGQKAILAKLPGSQTV